MHQVILGSKRNGKIDHRNGNGLDNRRKNLRMATTKENGCNTNKYRNNSPAIKEFLGIKKRKNGKVKFQLME